MSRPVDLRWPDGFEASNRAHLLDSLNQLGVVSGGDSVTFNDHAELASIRPCILRSSILTMETSSMTSETPRQGPNGYKAESIDTFLEVLQRRRSIRTGFLRDEPVPDDLIEKILEAARWAPSAGNSQPGDSL